MISIDIVSDTVCPWCFIGKRRLERAIQQRPDNQYRIGWRPFQLNPELPVDGMDRQQYLSLKFGGLERASKIYDQVREAGRTVDLAFEFETIGRQPNTFDAHRLIRWSAEADAQDAVVEALFRRYFFEAADIGDRDVLIAIAVQGGMDGHDLRQRFELNADAAVVREEEMTARRMGVTGVPCFIVNRKYAVSGAQDPSVLVNVFDVTAREETQAADDAVGA